MIRRALACVIISFVAAARLTAQKTDTTKSCLAADTPLRDTTYRNMFAWTDSLELGGPTMAVLRREALYETAKFISISAGTTRLMIRIPPSWAEDPSRLPQVHRAEISLTAHTDGSLTGVRLEIMSGSPELDSVLNRAIAAIDSAFRERGRLPGDSLRARIILEVTPSSNGVFLVAAMPVAVATLHPTRFAELLPDQRLPHPEGGPQRGSVMAYLRVGRDGRPIPGSIRIVSSTSNNLSDAVLEVLPTWRFTPANYDDCPINWEVMQPFTFR